MRPFQAQQNAAGAKEVGAKSKRIKLINTFMIHSSTTNVLMFSSDLQTDGCGHIRLEELKMWTRNRLSKRRIHNPPHWGSRCRMCRRAGRMQMRAVICMDYVINSTLNGAVRGTTSIASNIQRKLSPTPRCSRRSSNAKCIGKFLHGESATESCSWFYPTGSVCICCVLLWVLSCS